MYLASGMVCDFCLSTKCYHESDVGKGTITESKMTHKIFPYSMLFLMTVCIFAVVRFADGNGNFKENTGVKTSMSDEKMKFGHFSISLAVKDIKASKEFYEKLDFEKTGGDLKHNYLIMQNGTTTIGLFQGMFKDNILTFNPGWNHKAEKLERFQDVRQLQAKLTDRGIKPVTKAKEGNGPASFVIVDPDGNSILIDQHVPKPE